MPRRPECWKLQGAPTQVPRKQTPQGGPVPFPQGSQQSAVTLQPELNSGTQLGFSHRPTMSGRI
jgi:hypothetical protein